MILHVTKGQPESRDLLLDFTGVSEQREVHHIPQAHDFRRPEDPFLSAFGQNDVPTLRPGPAHEIVLEHERRHAGGAHDGDALLQPLQVNIGFENPKGPGDLPLIFRVDPCIQGVYHGRRHEGVGLDGEDGDRRTSQACEEPLHLRHRFEAAGEDEPGNPRVGGGRIGHEGPDHDVGAVTGHDDQAAFLQMVQKVGQFHGRHLVMSHFPVKPLRVSVQHFGSESPLYFADRGLVEERVCRQDEHGNSGGCAFLKSCSRLRHIIRCDPVDDHRKDVTLLCFEGFRQHAHGIHDLPDTPVPVRRQRA